MIPYDCGPLRRSLSVCPAFWELWCKRGADSAAGRRAGLLGHVWCNTAGSRVSPWFWSGPTHLELDTLSPTLLEQLYNGWRKVMQLHKVDRPPRKETQLLTYENVILIWKWPGESRITVEMWKMTVFSHLVVNDNKWLFCELRVLLWHLTHFRATWLDAGLLVETNLHIRFKFEVSNELCWLFFLVCPGFKKKKRHIRWTVCGGDS